MSARVPTVPLAPRRRVARPPAMREPPAGLVQALNDSQATLEATLAAGEGWKVRLKEHAGALVVTSRAGPKSGPVIVRGALRVSLPAVGADGEADSELARRVFKEYVLYERRVVWDAGIASQTQIRAYADGQHSVNAYEVHGAAGGLVQARYFGTLLDGSARRASSVQGARVRACEVSSACQPVLALTLSRGLMVHSGGAPHALRRGPVPSIHERVRRLDARRR